MEKKNNEPVLNDEEEKELLDTVKYTSNIRSFTLDEIADYLSFEATVEEIRSALEPHLYDLSMVKDGDEFRRVEESEISVDFTDDDRKIPSDVQRSVTELLPSLKNNQHLKESVDKLRGRYWSEEEVEYSRWDCLAYLVYHFPAYYVETKHVLSKIPIKNRMRVLDVGAGVGAPALGLSDALPDDTLVDYTALEPSVASEFLNDLLEVTSFNFHTRVLETAVENYGPNREYDLILLFNVINELDSPENVVESLLGSLSEDGNLVVVEPAELETAVPMRELQREFQDDYTVYGPCTFMWGDEKRCTDRCWSFDTLDFEPPRYARRFASGNQDYLRDEVKYSYFVLRKDFRTRHSYEGDVSREARMYDMEKHVGNRIRITVTKMSHDLGESMYKVCDGSAQKEHYAVIRGETDYNRPLKEADYGEILRFEDVLVYHNENQDVEDPESYHLVVDDESVVTRLG